MDGDKVTGPAGGDTTACRTYHATAAEDAPEVHCPHAAPDGGGVCVDPRPGEDDEE